MSGAVVHVLKIEPQFLNALLDGSKTFEVRVNDRGYQAGDVLRFYGGEPYARRDFLVTYVLSGTRWGICDGWVVMGLRPDPQPAGAVTAEPTADTGPDPEPLCECGHGPRAHYLHGCGPDGQCPCGAYHPTPSPQPEPTHVINVHVTSDTGLEGVAEKVRRAIDAFRNDAARVRAGRTRPEPTTLVDRVERAMTDPGVPAGRTSAAHRAALEVADWLDEQGALSYSHVAARIRREVGE